MSSESFVLKIASNTKLFQKLLFEDCEFTLVQKEDKGFVYSASLQPLKDLVTNFKSEDFEIEALEEDGWRDKWTESLEPVEISSLKLKIIPHINEKEPARHYAGNEIGLFPGRSFGIGHHETTKIMLELFGRHQKVFEGANVLDFGCGSGILGIIASRLGAKSVLSIDVDDEAVRVTNINALLNQIKNLESSKSMQGQFNVLLINTLMTVMKKEYPRIKNYLTPAANVFASGFLFDQVDVVARLLSLTKIETLKTGDWAGMFSTTSLRSAARPSVRAGKKK